MTSRAVHIEMTHSLNSDSFIQGPRRVITHRGNIKALYSDNGTNFVGCENELKKAYKEMVNERIQSFMQSYGGDLLRWIRNPPAINHRGGVWERQISSGHAILSSLLSTHGKSLYEESLLNSSPLTVETIGNHQVISLLPRQTI